MDAKPLLSHLGKYSRWAQRFRAAVYPRSERCRFTSTLFFRTTDSLFLLNKADEHSRIVTAVFFKIRLLSGSCFSWFNFLLFLQIRRRFPEPLAWLLIALKAGGSPCCCHTKDASEEEKQNPSWWKGIDPGEQVRSRHPAPLGIPGLTREAAQCRWVFLGCLVVWFFPCISLFGFFFFFQFTFFL